MDCTENLIVNSREPLVFFLTLKTVSFLHQDLNPVNRGQCFVLVDSTIVRTLSAIHLPALFLTVPKMMPSVPLIRLASQTKVSDTVGSLSSRYTIVTVLVTL